jgi:hypothetical protein
MFLPALGLVQPDQHGGIPGGLGQQLQPVPGGQTAEEFVLTPYIIGVADLLGAGGEVAMPEQGHLFLERTRACSHAIEPPAAQLVYALPLQLLLLPQQLPSLLVRRLPIRLKPLFAIRIGRGPVRRGRRVRVSLIIHKHRHRRVRTQLDELLHGRGRAAEPGSIQQVCRGDGIPFPG